MLPGGIAGIRSDLFALAGTQFPVVVTDSAWIFSNTTGPWYLPGSADRVFGPLGN